MKTLRLSLCMLGVAGVAWAGSPLPELRVGDTWEYAYLNQMIYEGPPVGMTNETKGRMVMKLLERVTTNGATYFKGQTEYHGIFGIPPQVIHVRADAGGYYTATDIRGEWVESRALAFPPDPGARWTYFDGEPGWRTIAGTETIEHAGYRYERCLRVERGFDDPEKARQFTQKEWYAPGVGLVRYHFLQVLGPTRSETQTILTSFTPGGGGG